MWAIALILHVLSATIWVGGMFFAYMALRPVAAQTLEPPHRLTLWAGVFAKFFPWVWVSIALLLGTGLWMVINVMGGFSNVPPYIHAMLTLGIVMMLIFGHVFGVYMKLKKAVAAKDWPTAGQKLANIRIFIAINLAIGLITIAVATGGRYLVL